jgi:hypothetical protein
MDSRNGKVIPLASGAGMMKLILSLMYRLFEDSETYLIYRRKQDDLMMRTLILINARAYAKPLSNALRTHRFGTVPARP